MKAVMLIFVMSVQFECVCCPRIELNNYDARPIVFGVTLESVWRPLLLSTFEFETLR